MKILSEPQATNYFSLKNILTNPTETLASVGGGKGEITMKSPYSCSLKNTLPEIGLQLMTMTNFSNNIYYCIYTGAKYAAWAECEQCGIAFIYVRTDNNKQRFCCRGCANKFIQSKKRIAYQKLIYKNIDKQKFSDFYKKYTGYVYAKISEYEREYRDDFMEWWQEKAAYFFKKITDFEKAMKRESYRYAFIDKAIAYGFLAIKSKREKEVFYNECSAKIQQKILGTCNYED